MKRILAVFLMSLLFLISNSVTISAENVESYENEKIVLRDQYEAWGDSRLIINSNKKATCKSDFFDNDLNNIYSIRVVQTLQKKVSSNSYSNVSGAQWTQTVYTDHISMTNYKNNLSSGTYRLKSVFTVTLTNGSSEVITICSPDKTV
jgi:hypothetical protein